MPRFSEIPVVKIKILFLLKGTASWYSQHNVDHTSPEWTLVADIPSTTWCVRFTNLLLVAVWQTNRYGTPMIVDALPRQTIEKCRSSWTPQKDRTVIWHSFWIFLVGFYLYFLSFWVTSKLVRPPLPGSKGMFVRPWRKLRIRHRAWAVWQGMLGISWECPYGVN